MMKKIVFLLGVFMLLQVSRARVSMEERFKRWDRNGDGVVTKNEIYNEKMFAMLLQKLDKNKNGQLEASEVTTANSRKGNKAYNLEVPVDVKNKKYSFQYRIIEGVNPNFLSLDFYVPEGVEKPESGFPVMIMIHGGGWTQGDKARMGIVGNKMKHFVANGYIYASINYRLSARNKDRSTVKHPDHVSDCAAAIAWIHDNIAKYGGNRDSMHLMGHSAGGHLAALVATNERFLKANNKDLSIIKTNVLLDPAVLNIPDSLKNNTRRSAHPLYNIVFGDDEKNIIDGSPQNHVEAGKHIPKTIIFYAANRMQLGRQGPAFADSITKAGSPSKAIDTLVLEHGEVSSLIGMQKDPMTELIMKMHNGIDPTTFPATIEYYKNN